MFYKKGGLNNFLKFFQSLFFQLFKNKNSVIGALLWILRNFQEHFFYRTPTGDGIWKKGKSVVINWYKRFYDKIGDIYVQIRQVWEKRQTLPQHKVNGGINSFHAADLFVIPQGVPKEIRDMKWVKQVLKQVLQNGACYLKITFKFRVSKFSKFSARNGIYISWKSHFLFSIENKIVPPFIVYSCVTSC